MKCRYSRLSSGSSDYYTSSDSETSDSSEIDLADFGFAENTGFTLHKNSKGLIYDKTNRHLNSKKLTDTRLAEIINNNLRKSLTCNKCKILIDINSPCARLTCEHWFHLNCIMDYLETKRRCPTCHTRFIN